MTTKLLPSSGEVSIGRSPSCDLTINDASVSRRHATLRISPLEIVDEGSRNGTRVRGKPIASGIATPIAIGDALQLGEAAIMLQLVTLSFDRKSVVVDDDDGEASDPRAGDAPLVLVQVVTDDGDPAAVEELLRASLDASDAIKSDGLGGFQVLLGEASRENVSLAVQRAADHLRKRGVRARFGVARYPADGVVIEQLIAHAYEQVERSPDAAPSPMDSVREIIRQVAEGDLSVLITGETGVGKELCAETIHRLSPRAAGPFIKFNCSALVESLIESELFGHEKGAFTGATSANPGLLESGNGGTVFLDEIGELPLAMQAKLLRVIEERIVRRVGATSGKKIDVRFVFATNRDLIEEVEAGRFRRDLYYRINGLTIAIPPLRERQGEIIPLARAFATRARDGAPIALGNEVIAALVEHSWPGNVRELRNTIERAVLLSSGGAIRPTHLVLTPPRDQTRTRESQPTMPITRVSDIDITVDAPSRPSASLASEVAELERKRIVEALEQYGGNQTQVARVLGVSRGTLIARMELYGLRRPRKRDD